ncbi:MAG TPA: helix-hairpin-helix domain-containing protein [Ktedonobacterales bacterium]|nr:helix-hairpin-helix domain-containing protein [Ktedonobacterales bacterium]
MRATTEDMAQTRAEAIRDLLRIPGVGPSIAQDLLDLGARSVADLEGADPEALYEQLCALRGAHQDRCLLYVFRCAVYFAGPGPHEPERLRWWAWKDASNDIARGT